jgi:medium-chain acyl-[acyl-carrier-protein] hydrolase
MTAYLDSPVPAAALRLVCFPYAGGGTVVYRRWGNRLGPGVAVCPVLLPGRERRVRERRFTDMDAQVAELDAELRPHLDTPHVFFGHSMGALLAYRLAQRRRASGASLPRALVLSSAITATSRLLTGSAGTPVSPLELAQKLVDLGGLPQDVLARPDWLEVLLPVVRDDLLMCESAADLAAPPLPIPFHAFGGRQDPLVAATDLAEWQRHSLVGMEVKLFTGGHFYFREGQEQFLPVLRSTVDRYIGGPARPAPRTWGSRTWDSDQTHWTDTVPIVPQ